MVGDETLRGGPASTGGLFYEPTVVRPCASGILDGLTADQQDIFPDPNAQTMSQIWWSDPKSFERAFSGVATAP